MGGKRFGEARFDSSAILAYWCTLLQALLGRAIAFRLCYVSCDVARPIALTIAQPGPVRGRGRLIEKKKNFTQKYWIRALSNFIPTLLVLHDLSMVGDFFRS